MGRRVDDVVTPELEDFAVWLRNTYKPAQGIRACWPLHGGAALQLEALLDWCGRVEQLRLSGDGQAGPIVGQQTLLWHDALYRTLPHITQETSSCSRGHCVERQRLAKERETWQIEERETAERSLRRGATRPGSPYGLIRTAQDLLTQLRSPNTAPPGTSAPHDGEGWQRVDPTSWLGMKPLPDDPPPCGSRFRVSTIPAGT